MPYEILIGRGAQQPFIIPGNCNAVSHHHARFQVDDDGNWSIQDLTGPNGNGTFVQDSTGVFRRIQTKMIDRDTVIRLGSGGHNSFTFYANRVIAPDDFSYEFGLIHSRLHALQEEQARLEAENEKKARRIKAIRTTGTLIAAISALLSFVASMPGVIGVTVVAGGIATFCPAPDQKKLKALLEKKKALLVCPKCFQPISETALYNRMCPLCKAKG